MIYAFDQLLDKVNTEVKSLPIPLSPDGLFEPIRYELAIGGKRIRPVVCLMACNLFTDQIDAALPAAMGVEVFHNFTLMHDDIMDKADMRRGKPTVHNIWNVNTAILSGDAMQILAYSLIARTPIDVLHSVFDLFNRTALEVCIGQQYDIDFEGRIDVVPEEYLEMIRLKTAVLLAGSLKIGAIIGGATPQDAASLYAFGENVGLAFQLQDDLLDVYGDPALFGKNIGGDIVCNKKTYLLIKALELAEGVQRTQLDRWIVKKEFDPQEKIASVTELYNQIGVKKMCEDLMRLYFDKALAALDEVSVPVEKKEQLRNVAIGLMTRVS